jgi:hypothetical protein
MLRLVLGTLLAAVLLVGCGGESEPKASPEAAKKSSAPAYFVKSDTDAVNQATTLAIAAGNRAVDKKKLTACNKASRKGYAAWRTCWHDLLDPLQSSLGGVQVQLTVLSEKERLPKACADELTTAAGTFADFAEEVDVLRAGIDSDDRAAQLETGRTYVSTIRRIGDSYAEPFQSLTKVCYSPGDQEELPTPATPSP